MRSYDKVFYSLFKDKIIELCLSSLLWKENEVFISESSQVILRTTWIVWRLFIKVGIHKIFHLHATLLNAHGV